MNKIAIGIHIQVNHKRLFVGCKREIPKLATLKVIARYEIGRLKREARNLVERVAINRAIGRVAMAFNPMPAMALA